MVEGGAIDWASHGNQSGRMIEEQIDFDNAVDAVMDWVRESSNWGETLLIVTGDHETGYLTGPGSDPSWEFIVNNGAGNLPGLEWHSGSHTNSLIPLSAKGDFARALRRLADEFDPVHGPYVDNTELAQVLFWTLDLRPAPSSQHRRRTPAWCEDRARRAPATAWNRVRRWWRRRASNPAQPARGE
jgi:alkaline phosphatase